MLKILLLINESVIAARRYKQYKREREKGSTQKKVIAFFVQLLMAVFKLFTKAKILRRRKVESVIVE
jgi:hypothetical protein